MKNEHLTEKGNINASSSVNSKIASKWNLIIELKIIIIIVKYKFFGVIQKECFLYKS